MSKQDGIWTEWQRFDRQTAADRAEAERIRQDPELKPEARDAKVGEIGERFVALGTKAVEAQRSVVEDLRTDYVNALPANAERWAALSTPEKRREAAEQRQLAEGATADDLRVYAADIANRRSLVRAHGLRQAVERNESIDPAVRKEVIQTLDGISADSSRAALAALVGAQHALNGFEAFVKRSDPRGGAVDPVALLHGAQAAATVPTPDGGVRHLSTAEFNELVEASGVPMQAPGHTPADKAAA